MTRDTYNSVDELDIARALGVAVTSSVLGTSLVGAVAGLATVLVHGDEVEGAVQAASDVVDIDIKGELVAKEVEHLVVVVILHEVETAADVGAVWTNSHELEVELAAARGDSVGARVVGTIETALGGARLPIGAEGLVPGVSAVAVGGAVGAMGPSPVGVNHDRSADVVAAAGCAL